MADSLKDGCPLLGKGFGKKVEMEYGKEKGKAAGALEKEKGVERV